MPAGNDAEVAELFRDFRSASSLSETDLAAKLLTRVDVVQALEEGALYALPPWAETCRVITAYGTLLNLDIRPLLRRIYAQIDAGVVDLQPKAMAEVPSMPAQNGSFDQAWQRGPVEPAQPKPLSPQAPARAEPYFAQPFPPRAPAPSQSSMPPQSPRPGQGSVPPQQAVPSQQSFPPQRPMPPQMPPQQLPPAFQRPEANFPENDQFSQPRPFPVEPARQPEPPVTPERSAQTPQVDAVLTVDEPEASKRRPLLKWIVLGLIALGVVLAVWMVFGRGGHHRGPPPPQATAPSNPALDPDDPRSHKEDRLPSRQP